MLSHKKVERGKWLYWLHYYKWFNSLFLLENYYEVKWLFPQCLFHGPHSQQTKKPSLLLLSHIASPFPQCKGQAKPIRDRESTSRSTRQVVLNLFWPCPLYNKSWCSTAPAMHDFHWNYIENMSSNMIWGPPENILRLSEGSWPSDWITSTHRIMDT